MTANTAPAAGRKTDRGTEPNDQKERATGKSEVEREREREAERFESMCIFGELKA